MEVSRRTKIRMVGKKDWVGPDTRGREKWEMGDSLDRELAALAIRILVSVICGLTMDQAVWRFTHRNHPEKGRLASVLQSNHGHIHLGRPASN